MTTVLNRWLVTKRYSNVRWISLWNEPDRWYKFGGDDRSDFPLYWGALDDRLRATKLRSHIGIVAADTTQGGSIAVLAFPALDARASADAYSTHDYLSAVEAPGRESGGVIQPFLRGYAVLTKAVKAGMQVAVTEVQGGKDADGTPRL